jgi:hypothetical protein
VTGQRVPNRLRSFWTWLANGEPLGLVLVILLFVVIMLCWVVAQ